METTGEAKRILGLNGLGRIGKLTVWHHAGRKFFDEIVVNLGRKAGTSLNDVAHYLERDSTYGRLERYLYGYASPPLIEDVNEAEGTMTVNGVLVRFLQSQRNPADINWREYRVRLVLDATGKYLDPAALPDNPKGALRGHLAAGAEKVIVSAPFKLKGAEETPADAVTTVMGINDHDFDPRRHRIISTASCTTTCLAHMMKPLIRHFGGRRILSASMATVHAVTGSQQVLDRLVESGKTDLRKDRSVMNNIILTSTGAAKALGLVIPEMREIGFIAESVRVPLTTGSLIILVVNFQEDPGGEAIRREGINQVYCRAEKDDPRYLHFSDQQNVSCDIIGTPRAAAIIEGCETHTRTTELSVDLGQIPELEKEVRLVLKNRILKVPMTQAVIYGWYDNEMGSYVAMLGDRTVSIAEEMG